MERVIIDMDNVMADVNPQYKVFHNKVYGTDLDLDLLREQQKTGTVPDYSILHALLEKPGFFRTMTVIKDAQEVIKEINDRYEVFIVSSAMEYPQSLNEKLDWLAEHFPFLTHKQIVFCGSKVFVHGDHMIDDKTSNLKAFPGQKLLFSTPNNFRINDPLYQRVDTWQDVAKILL